MNADGQLHFSGSPRRPGVSSARVVGGGLALSLAVLGLLFLLQMQFTGGSQPAAGPAKSTTSQSTASPPVERPAPPVEDLRGTSSSHGPTFNSRAEFLALQESQGFQFHGRFDEDWPATVVAEQSAQDEILFTRANGTRHRYSNSQGYVLKVVRLQTHEGKEAVFVLRSKEKY